MLGGTIRLFDVDMHAWSMDKTLDVVDTRLQSEPFTQHVVVNVAKVVAMRKDPELRHAVSSCDIVNIDGAGVVFAGRMLGHKIPQRVAGIDLFFRLLEYAQESGKSVYFLGATKDVVAEAVARIRDKYPQLDIAGHHHGYFWENEEAAVKEVRESGADMLFVGISSPMKERFVDKWRNDLGVRFAMGVGGTFDVVAGKVKRAPKWMQDYGLEWVYRVIQEPRRMFWRYMSTNARFAGLLLSEFGRKLSSRRNKKRAGSLTDS